MITTEIRRLRYTEAFKTEGVRLIRESAGPGGTLASEFAGQQKFSKSVGGMGAFTSC